MCLNNNNKNSSVKRRFVKPQLSDCVSTRVLSDLAAAHGTAIRSVWRFPPASRSPGETCPAASSSRNAEGAGGLGTVQ